VAKLDAHGSAVAREGLLDRREGVLRNRPVEAEAGDLVERRIWLGEGGLPPGDGLREDAVRAEPSRHARGPVGEETGFGALDADGEGDVAEEPGGRILRKGSTGTSSTGRRSYIGDLHCMGRDGFIFFTERKNVTSTWFTGKAVPAKISIWDGTMTR
jgi:hypothetical protein